MRNLRIGLARLLAGDYVQTLERNAEDNDTTVNHRVAAVIAAMDPYEPLLRRFHGIFSEEFSHPEDNLDEQSKIRLEMWAYQQKNDAAFNHLSDWIMNSAGNETIKRAPISVERSQYGRAQIANMVLLKREINRLASHHEERLARQRGEIIGDSVVE